MKEQDIWGLLCKLHGKFPFVPLNQGGHLSMSMRGGCLRVIYCFWVLTQYKKKKQSSTKRKHSLSNQAPVQNRSYTLFMHLGLPGLFIPKSLFWIKRVSEVHHKHGSECGTCFACKQLGIARRSRRWERTKCAQHQLTFLLFVPQGTPNAKWLMD